VRIAREREASSVTTPILFIHGRGKNTDPAGWVDVVRESIRSAGHAPPGVDDGSYITVDYTDLLASEIDLPTAAMPMVTLPEADPECREEFLERAIALRGRYPRPRTWLQGQQLSDVLTAVTVRAFPLAHLPIRDRGLVELAVQLMGDVERYRSNQQLRANVLRRVLEALPTSGELIILGHSLGSVVALDLLSYLPEGVRVPLFATVGSPLPFRAIRSIGLPGVIAPLPFPHAKVDRWVNVVDTLDTVTGFTGVHTWWPEAVDVDVDNPSGDRHGVRAYFRHGVFGELVGEALGGTRLPAVSTPSEELVGHQALAHEEELAELALHFARCLLESEDDGEARERARLARTELLEMTGAAFGRPLSPDRCEETTHRWREAHGQLDRRVLVAQLAFSNPFEPFDPGIGDTALARALGRFCRELAIPDAEPAAGDLVALMQKSQEAVHPRSKGRLLKPLLIGVSTIGLVAVAAPAAVGLFAAAGAGGAAAFTSGLAALGGGGMAAGIGMVGGAGAGGGLLAAQLARSGADNRIVAANLVAIGATVRWLRRWGDEDIAREAESVADGLRQLVHQYESQLAFHDGRTSPQSEIVQNLQRSIRQTQRLISWLSEKSSSDARHRSPTTGLGEPSEAITVAMSHSFSEEAGRRPWRRA
jgi:pimeloyl-ACP methyl ester carboxylesterase